MVQEGKDTGKLEALAYKKKRSSAMIQGFVKRFVTFDPRTLTLCYTRHKLFQDDGKTLSLSQRPEVTMGRLVMFRSTVISCAMDVRACGIQGPSLSRAENWDTPEDALRHCGNGCRRTIVITDQGLVDRARDLGFASSSSPTHFGFSVNTSDRRGLKFYFETFEEASKWRHCINNAWVTNARGVSQIVARGVSRLVELDRISVGSVRSTEDTDGEKDAELCVSV
jgi:hypothetical protein